MNLILASRSLDIHVAGLFYLRLSLAAWNWRRKSWETGIECGWAFDRERRFPGTMLHGCVEDAMFHITPEAIAELGVLHAVWRQLEVETA
jgi:hypothetical protein